MQPDARTCIAYIAGSLITGKREFSFYDYSRSLRVDMSSLPYARCLSQAGYAPKVYLPDFSRGARYRYACGCGHFFDIVIHGSTFIGYVLDGSSHFIGNVRGDSIYLYDQRESAHFNYRISRDAGDDDGWNQVCVSCVARSEGRMYEG
jgi:hypothetical protein